MGGELIRGGGEGLIRGVELIREGEAYTCVCLCVCVWGGGGVGAISPWFKNHE